MIMCIILKEIKILNHYRNITMIINKFSKENFTLNLI